MASSGASKVRESRSRESTGDTSGESATGRAPGRSRRVKSAWALG